MPVTNRFQDPRTPFHFHPEDNLKALRRSCAQDAAQISKRRAEHTYSNTNGGPGRSVDACPLKDDHRLARADLRIC